MTDKETINERDFPDRVSNEFYRLKGLSEMEKLPVEELKLTFGCFSIPLIPILQRMTVRALKPEKEKQNYESLTDKANSILNSEDIKKAVRKAFEELPKNEIVTEETFLRVFTEILRQDELRQRLDIPLDPVLFAMVSYGIFKKGIREFCDGGG